MFDLGDLPGGADQSVAYSIDSYGRVVGFGSTAAGSRAFIWTPTASGTTNTITVFANDNPTNGAVVKTDTKTFTVNVNADPLAAQSVESGTFISAGETVALTWNAQPGQTYQVQYKEGTAWVNLGEPSTVDSNNGSIVVNNEGSERYFRIVEIGEGASDE